MDLADDLSELVSTVPSDFTGFKAKHPGMKDALRAKMQECSDDWLQDHPENDRRQRPGPRPSPGQRQQYSMADQGARRHEGPQAAQRPRQSTPRSVHQQPEVQPSQPRRRRIAPRPYAGDIHSPVRQAYETSTPATPQRQPPGPLSSDAMRLPKHIQDRYSNASRAWRDAIIALGAADMEMRDAESARAEAIFDAKAADSQPSMRRLSYGQGDHEEYDGGYEEEYEEENIALEYDDNYGAY
ncbi:hypothetical protein G7046_g8453 [Stylonectria norvegica]|nr:hypothetical protein G7046_g8453 [Stylonectria norvegica]